MRSLWLGILVSTMMLVACGDDDSDFSTRLTQGTFTDFRDGQTYRTVKIGEQVWMAENLNFKTDSSWCYNDEESNCQKYGRLYSWNAARSACPVDWHLPSKAEFETLLKAVGGMESRIRKMKKNGWVQTPNSSPLADGKTTRRAWPLRRLLLPSPLRH